MKKTLLVTALIAFSFLLEAQAWRPGEMEARLKITHPQQMKVLQQMKLQGDVYPDGQAILYLVPEELQLLKEAGFSPEVTIADLNFHYRDFWLNRDEYHSYDEIIQVMNTLAFLYPSICVKYQFGSSVEGRQLAALKISDNAGTDEDEPEVMFDGGIHGDEIGGPENLIRFAEDLCEAYGNDPVITDLIDNREIWLYMMVNPDGRVNMWRYNVNGVDLNRDWGYMWDAWGNSPGAYSQPESKALRSAMLDNQFVVYITYHSGTEIYLYPWSYRADPAPEQPSLEQAAIIYVESSGYPYLEYGQACTGLYPVNGSTKDAYYGIMGSISATMELSTHKQPPTSQIQYYYDINKPSMLAMIEIAGYGIHGTVTDAETGEPVSAMIIADDGFPVYTDPGVGDFHKYLVPGTYDLQVRANGYEPAFLENMVVETNYSTEANFTLVPADARYAWRVMACRIPENNPEDEGNTPGALWAPDQVNYSLGRAGWIILDMQSSVFNGPGNEITVYEGDSYPEGFDCYASTSPDGPWTYLGEGYGTTTFDFADSDLDVARYIRINDDGDGAWTGPDIGIDLDAVEALAQPPVVFLVLDCLVDDQASGNGDNRIDPGEEFDLVLTLQNRGGLAALGTMVSLNYDSTWINAYTDEVNAGDIGYGGMTEIILPMSADSATPLQTVVMSVVNVIANDGEFWQSFPVNFTVGAILEDWETNSFTQFTWSFSGAKPWTTTPLNPYEGLYSARSGNIDDGQYTSLQVTMNVIGIDDISFFRKISSESGKDFMKFYIDGSVVDLWSGDSDWEKVSYQVEPGSHIFRWTFEKDGAGSIGFDGGWIDYIVFPSYNPNGSLHAIANALPDEFCDAGQSHLGAYAIGGSGNFTYSWSPEEGLDDPAVQFPLATLNSSMLYTVQVDDGSGNIEYPAILVSVFPTPAPPTIEQQGDSLVSSYASGNQWYNSDGAIDGATGQVFYPPEEGFYHVIVTGDGGCVSQPSEPVYFQFTGIDDITGMEWLKIYPNPAGDHLNISTGQGLTGTYHYLIVDPSGRKQRIGSFKTEFPGEAFRIGLAGLSPGIYSLRIVSEAGHRMIHHKFIKK